MSPYPKFYKTEHRPPYKNPNKICHNALSTKKENWSPKLPDSRRANLKLVTSRHHIKQQQKISNNQQPPVFDPGGYKLGWRKYRLRSKLYRKKLWTSTFEKRCSLLTSKKPKHLVHRCIMRQYCQTMLWKLPPLKGVTQKMVKHKEQFYSTLSQK